jgi:hypothetical protein
MNARSPIIATVSFDSKATDSCDLHAAKQPLARM